MDLQLQDKVALVTGSSAGLGAAIARSLGREGVTVLVHGRDEQRTQSTADEIVKTEGRAFPLVADISTDDGAASLVEQVKRHVTGIDILINNVGIFINRTWDEATAADWAEIYNTNVLSAVRLVHLLAPHMHANKWGRIIQIATSEAAAPFPNMPDYAASKAAMVNLTLSLSKNLSGTGITVNTVSPGIIATQAVQNWYRDVAKERGWGTEWSEIERTVLREVLPNTVGRLGNEDEVANLVTFLASPLAGYINGSNYRIDGGSTATVN